jgi:hypothetical protein
MKIEYLASRCFLCGANGSIFDAESRVCDCVRLQGFAEDELPCYVTFLPEPQCYSVPDLPSIWTEKWTDVFAIAAGNLGLSSETIAQSKETIRERVCPFPYKEDILSRTYQLRCGNALLYRSASLEGLTGSELVLILDMGSYHWSGTLKDPRSWAIINTALANRATEIAVWTAGNAGFSLAKLAYAVNRRLPPEQRLQIHCIVDNEVAPEIRAQLRLWQSEVLDIFRQDRPVLNPKEIRDLVATRIHRSRRTLHQEAYWHVTDGWDGVGLLMYRLIAAQVIRDLSTTFLRSGPEPLEIILPVGTGSLLLGFYLGLKDCEFYGVIPKGACRIVGVLPAGDNILANIRQRSIPTKNDDTFVSANGVAPVMPKLRGLYTPLAPCLARVEREEGVEFLAVTGADQLRAGRQILAGGIDDGIVAEPSALATFGALPHLQNRTKRIFSENQKKYSCRRRTLVVNSGCGVMGRTEEMILHRALGI